jgi:hypothetical protein
MKLKMEEKSKSKSNFNLAFFKGLKTESKCILKLNNKRKFY